MTPVAPATMADVEAIPKNGLRVASTFSGCGGSCLGLRMAGFDVRTASEFVPAARDAYRANHPTTYLDERDIREVEPADILERVGVDVGELDVFEGSPPCASFSVSGNREADWGKVKKYSDVKQRTDDLFLEWLRLLEGLKPKAFVAENVAGLVRGAAKGWFLEILERMRAAGYRVKAGLLDAGQLGVPQTRRRTIFVGVREDLGKEPVLPKPSVVVTLGEACPWITNWSKTARPGPNSAEELAEVNIERFAIFPEWSRLRPGQGSDKYLNLIRADANRPSPTITATGGSMGAAGPCHPSEPRKFTLRELRIISGFPSDFVLPGTFAQAWERIGRSVPPPMMAAVGRELAKTLLKGTP